MDNAERHLDAGSILDRAKKLDPRVHRVTVYRTLDLLKRNGLIDELDLLHLRGDQHFYESHGPRDHIHVACLKCGTVREFESQIYEKLKKQIEKDCGIRNHHRAHGSGRILRKMQQEVSSIATLRCAVFAMAGAADVQASG